MKKQGKAPINIDDYIAQFPKEIQIILNNIRNTIRSKVPGAMETIRYGMPTFKLKRNLVHFAAYKNHIGFYPTPKAIEKFKQQLAAYQTSKGTIRFALDQPVPYDLISEIVTFRVAEESSA